MDGAFTEYGVLADSGEFTGLSTEAAKKGHHGRNGKEKDRERKKVHYRLRDWLISRQRYWGCPIPIINCPSCGPVLVPEKDLPVILPEDVNFVAGAMSPLQTSEAFLHCKCPHCGRDAVRETDTMDTFIDSSWYFIRYTDPHNAASPFDKRRPIIGCRSTSISDAGVISTLWELPGFLPKKNGWMTLNGSIY